MADGSAYHDEMMAELLGDFLDESGHLLSRLNETLLAVDQMLREGAEGFGPTGAGGEMLNEMFRAAHSLKGLSGMLGFHRINQLTHRMENVFDAARKGQLQLDLAAVDILFRAVDSLAEQIDSIRRGEGEGPAPEAILGAISQLLQQAGAERPIGSQRDAEAILSQLSHAEEIVNEAIRQFGGDRLVEEGPEEAAACPGAEVGAEPLGDGAGCFASPKADLGETVPTAAINTSQSQRVEPVEAVAAPEEHTARRTIPAAGQAEDPFAGVVDDDISGGLAANYLPIFVDEARSSLDELHEALLSCEEDGDPHAAEKLMVIAHRLKGAAAAVGLRRAAKLAHLAEDFLQTLSEKRHPLEPNHVEALLHVVDALRNYVDKLAGGIQDNAVLCEPAVRLSQQTKLLEHAEASCGPVGHTSIQAQLPDNPTPVGGAHSSALGKRPVPEEVPEEFRSLWDQAASCLVARPFEMRIGYVGLVLFGKQVQLVGLKARLVLEKLASLGEVVYCHPPGECLEEAENVAGLLFACWSDAAPEVIRRQLSVGGVHQVVICRVVGEASPAAELSQEFSEPGGAISAAHTPGISASPVDDAKRSPEAKSTREESPVGRPGNVSTAGNLTGPKGTELVPRAEAQASRGVPSRSAQKVGDGVGRETHPGGARSSTGTAQVGETLRVDIERLDELMNLTGELVIQRARLNQLVESLRAKMAESAMAQTIRSLRELIARMHRNGSQVTAGPITHGSSQTQTIWNLLEELEAEQRQWVDLRAVTNELRVSVHQLDRITDRLQQTVMNTRMVPIGPLFHRFKRVVRDLVRSSGKQIRLVINGEKTELDKRMIDELTDPLIHLVRNAADHGIEPPEERVRRGKPAEGTLLLEACHKGNAIVIRVSDDGRGLDAEKIRRKAVEKGFLTPAEAERLSPQEIYQLIWRPGLSTAEKVTEISGRGMGMDIVKAKIEALNGSVELHTEPGVGTTFTIKLPLTLAILPSLLVRVTQNTFAIPVDTIVEIVQLAHSDIATVQGVPTAIVRGRVIPICRLQELFIWNYGAFGEFSRGQGAEAQGTDRVTLVILADRHREIGLHVDHVIGEEDLVIKSLADNYRNIPGLTGASILGDGSVALILDVAALVEMASGGGGVRW
ncbi:MAG: Hpt domain-containing protein [Thermoguttaceae bacterium]|nr:Hpt domain-containing protein [Thermoguttaceae bacterium]MDW8078746.1 Hpt domain-containing protein [Thermoguttaceae bacterium]